MHTLQGNKLHASFTVAIDEELVRLPVSQVSRKIIRVGEHAIAAALFARNLNQKGICLIGNFPIGCLSLIRNKIVAGLGYVKLVFVCLVVCECDCYEWSP
jgi:hypothetical protein